MAVRAESVRLSLDDAGFTSGMIKAASATALLDRNLESLNGSAVSTRRSVMDADDGIVSLGTSADRSGNQIDKLSGRLALIAQAAAVLGPALLPIGAVAVPAITGLATAGAAAAVAGGSMIVAFQGVGDAVKAMNEQALNPSAANMEKLREAMAVIGPDAARFVKEFQAFRPVLTDIRDSAAAGWFPGLIESLSDFEAIAPRVANLFEQVGRAGGEMVADAAASFNSDRWTPFFDFVTAEMPAALTSLGQIVGDLTHGAAEMWMAFDPANDSFLSWMEGVASGFDSWASSAGGREDIAAFLDYVAQTGPQVEEFFVALVGAFTQIAQAAAPLGGPVLSALTGVANAIAAIADSDLGTPIFAGLAALSLYNRALATTAALQKSAFGVAAGGGTTAAGSPGGFIGGQVAPMKAAIPSLQEFGTVAKFAGQGAAYASEETLKARESVRGFAAASAPAIAAGAGIALAFSGAADGMGLSNTASLALMGTLGGPWGAAIGGAIGLTMDMAAATDALDAALKSANANLSSGALTATISDLVTARTELASLQSDYDLGPSVPGGDYFSKVVAGPAALKNGIEDIFGDSDLEERAAEIAQVEQSAARLESTIAALAAATGMTIGPLDGSAASMRELDAVVAANQPRMDELRITMEELTTASAIQEQATSGGLFASIFADAPAATGALDGLLGAITGTTDAADAQRQSMLAAANAMREKSAAALGSFDAETRYREALKAATAQARSNSQGIRGNTDAALANRASLGQLAAAWNNQSNAVKNNVARFRESRSAFIETAVAMGVPEKAARDLANRIMEIPKSRVTDIRTTGTSESEALLKRVRAAIDALRDRTITVTTNYRTVGRASSASGGGFEPNVPNVATGGHIRGPGGPTDDAIEARLSNNEYVQRSAAVDYYGVGFMDQVNSLRFPKPSFATGGMLGRPGPALSAPAQSWGNFDAATWADRQLREFGGSVRWAAASVEDETWERTKSWDTEGKWREKELTQRQKMLAKDLEHAETKRQAELDSLNELKDARKSLADSVSGNFMSSLFNVDLRQAYESGALGSGFGQGLTAFAQGEGGSGLGDISQSLDAYLASMSSTQLQALQGQAALGTLQQDAFGASQFQAALEQLVGLGLDGGLFQELAASGSLGSAQALIGQGAGGIANLEQQYDIRNRQAAQVGSFAGDAEYRKEIRQQTRIAEQSRDAVRELNQTNRRLEQRLAALERQSERNPKETGREVGKAINGAVASGQRAAR